MTPGQKDQKIVLTQIRHSAWHISTHKVAKGLTMDSIQPISARSPNRARLIILGGIMLFVIVLLGMLAIGVRQKTAAALATGDAPMLELKTFDGGTINLAQLKGKPIVVNFWASWCIPCRDEAPLLEATWVKYKDEGLVVIGVDYLDTESEAKKFMQKFGITYPNGPDIGTRIAQAYRITGVPESYFVTRDGKLLQGTDASGRAYGNWIGPLSANAMEERVQKLLAR